MSNDIIEKSKGISVPSIWWRLTKVDSDKVMKSLKNYLIWFKVTNPRSLTDKQIGYYANELATIYNASLQTIWEGKICGLSFRTGVDTILTPREFAEKIKKTEYPPAKINTFDDILGLEFIDTSAYTFHIPWWIWLLLGTGGIGSIIILARRKK